MKDMNYSKFTNAILLSVIVLVSCQKNTNEGLILSEDKQPVSSFHLMIEDQNSETKVSAEIVSGHFVWFQGDEVSVFDEQDKNVKETQEVTLENGDASEFKISRLEDGAIAYDGKIVPLLAAHGDAEYFDFKSFLPSQKKEESPSFLKRIYDSLNDQSLVKVVTSKELHNLTDYVDTIFDALRTKLETTREVKDIKKRKRTPEDKK